MRVGIAIVAGACLCVGAVVVALVLHTGVIGTPSPALMGQTGPIAAAEPGLPYAGAPAVVHPLPESVLQRDPCADLLTADQVRLTLGTPTNTHRSDSRIGPGCTWANPVTGSQIDSILSAADRHGLSAVYQNTRPQSSLWIVLPPVRGYPAVAYDDAGSDSEHRRCQVSIGLNDRSTLDLGVYLGFQRAGKIEPCDAAATIADRVMETLLSKQ